MSLFHWLFPPRKPPKHNETMQKQKRKVANRRRNKAARTQRKQ